MGYIYVYDADDDLDRNGEYDTEGIGLCGALLAYEAEFEQRAGEFGEIVFKHPVDSLGKWQELQEGRLIKCEVPCRLPVEFDATEYETPGDPVADGITRTWVTNYRVWKVRSTATKPDRMLYYSQDEDGDARREKKKKARSKGTLSFKQKVTLLSDPHPEDEDARVKVRCTLKKKTMAGWMEKAGLEPTQEQVVAPDPTRWDWLEDVQPSYAILPQLFRIYSVETDMSATDAGTVTVRARRLVYDLNGNVTMLHTTGWHSASVFAKAILKKTLYKHPFTLRSDVPYKHCGLSVRGMNPINALIDPDEGLTALWGGEVFCDDYEIYYLRQVGFDRGVCIEYARNLNGLSCQVDTSDVVTSVMPVGRKANGDPLYLDGRRVKTKAGAVQFRYNASTNHKTGENALPSGYRFDLDDYPDGSGTPKSKRVGKAISRRTNAAGRIVKSYAAPKCRVIEVGDASVTKTNKDTDTSKTKVVTTAIARRLMVEAAIQEFENGCDNPAVTLDVDFTLLGDTEEYKQYRHAESLFVYDLVRIYHRPLGIDVNAKVLGIRWDIVGERMKGATFGTQVSAATGQILGKLQATGTMKARGYAQLSSGQLSPYATQQHSQMAYDAAIRRLKAADPDVDIGEASLPDARTKGIIVDPNVTGDDQNAIAMNGQILKVHVATAQIGYYREPGHWPQPSISTSQRRFKCKLHLSSTVIHRTYTCDASTWGEQDWWPEEGWTPLCVVGISFSNDAVTVTRLYLNNSDTIVIMGWYNGTNADGVIVTAKVHVLCAYNIYEDMNDEYSATIEAMEEELPDESEIGELPDDAIVAGEDGTDDDGETELGETPEGDDTINPMGDTETEYDAEGGYNDYDDDWMDAMYVVPANGEAEEE